MLPRTLTLCRPRLSSVAAAVVPLVLSRRPSFHPAVPVSAAVRTMTSSNSQRVIIMDPFCLKQFATDSTGQHISIPCTPDEFVQRTSDFYSAQNDPTTALKDGYAPFCKHLFIPTSHFSFPGAIPCSYAEITPENAGQMESQYAARTDKELPVLTRNFVKGSVTPPEATILDVILYSRAQIEKENAAMMDKPSSQPAGDSASSAPKLSKENDSHSAEAGKEWQWGIVSIKPQTVDYELPMNPITIMRNALGVEEGGSGIPLDRAAYLKSVEFWSKNAMVV